MDKNQLLTLGIHYLALLCVVFLVLFIVRTLVGTVGFWVEFGIVLVVAALYRPVVRRLGIAPSAWED